jgi:hypothetical protein
MGHPPPARELNGLHQQTYENESLDRNKQNNKRFSRKVHGCNQPPLSPISCYEYERGYGRCARNGDHYCSMYPGGSEDLRLFGGEATIGSERFRP